MNTQILVLSLLIISACMTSSKNDKRSNGDVKSVPNLNLSGIEVTLHELQNLRFPVINFVKGSAEAEIRYRISKKDVVVREGRTFGASILLTEMPAGEHAINLQACAKNKCGQSYSLSYVWPEAPKNAEEQELTRHLKEQKNYKDKIIKQAAEVGVLIDELAEAITACPNTQSPSQQEAIESFRALKQEERDNFFLFGDLSKFTHPVASGPETGTEPQQDKGPDAYAVAEAYLSLPLVVGMGYLIVADVKELYDWHALRKKLRSVTIDGRELILKRHPSGLLVPPTEVHKPLKTITHRYFEDPLTKELVVDSAGLPRNFPNFDPESIGMFFERNKAAWVDKSSRSILFKRDINNPQIIVDQAKGWPAVNSDFYTFRNDQLVLKNNVDESVIKRMREAQVKNIAATLPQRPRIAGAIVNTIAVTTVFTVIFSGFQTFSLADGACARLPQIYSDIKTKLETIEALRMEWVKQKILVLSRI